MIFEEPLLMIFAFLFAYEVSVTNFLNFSKPLVNNNFVDIQKPFNLPQVWLLFIFQNEKIISKCYKFEKKFFFWTS